TANAGMGANSRPWSVFRGRSANRSVTRADQKRRVMTPDEVRRLPRDKQLLFVDQIGYPIVTERAVYDQRPEWHFKHLRNP
ncbi:type IV secretory system conjugative DNA transfer family protein, partial [Acinetobacter baumannii]